MKQFFFLPFLFHQNCDMMVLIQRQAKTTIVFVNETFDSLQFHNLYFGLLKKSSGDTAIDFWFLVWSRMFESQGQKE